MENKNVEKLNVIDVASRFRTMHEVKELLTTHCERLIRFSRKKDSMYIPFVYNKERGIFSFSFDFFIETIAKFYEPGNKKIEDEINDLLKLSSLTGVKDKEILKKGNIDRAYIIISLFQQYYAVIFPNNRTFNVSHLRGIFSPKDSFYIPIVYEDKEGKPIQYEILPAKRDRLIDVGVSNELLAELIDISDKYKLKDVAFNASQVTKYWNESSFKKTRFE